MVNMTFQSDIKRPENIFDFATLITNVYVWKKSTCSKQSCTITYLAPPSYNLYNHIVVDVAENVGRLSNSVSSALYQLMPMHQLDRHRHHRNH